jgi:hypothetical protein
LEENCKQLLTLQFWIIQAGTVRYQQDQSEPYSTWTAIEPDHPSLPYDKLNLPSGHRLVRDTENKRKECVYCRPSSPLTNCKSSRINCNSHFGREL